MSKYDMDATYQDDYACTITDLCNEILKEAEKFPEKEKTVLSFDLIRSKISNSQGTGIVQKLNRMGLHIWEIAGEDKHEKYDALKVLKVFYYIEKDNLSQRRRVNITRILSNPCIDDLEIENYEKAFQSLYQSVYEQVKEGAVYEQTIDSIDQEWKSLINGLSKFIYRSDLVSRYDEVRGVLKQASNQLEVMKSHRSCGDSEQNDGVMRTLLLLLIRYKILAVNNAVRREDDDTLRLESSYDKQLAAGYLDKVIHGNAVVTWKQIDTITKSLKMDTLSLRDYLEHNSSDGFLSLYVQGYALGPVTGGDIVSAENKIHRVNAFCYTKDVAMWIQSLHNDLDFCSGLPLHVLAGIVQSIYHISKNRVQYSISSYGAAKKRTLLAALKDGMSADRTAVLNMESRVADRVLIMLGKKDILDYYHSIRRILLEMEDTVISYNSFAQIQKMHSELFHQARQICNYIG